MNPALLQVVFWLLIATVGLVVYELRESTKPPYCEHCAHCHAMRELEKQRHETPPVRQEISWRDHDDDDRH